MLRQLFLVAVAIGMASAHTRMLEPPSRSSLWRFEEFAHLNPEPNAIDDQNWCDNIRQFEVDNRCGVCGDALSQPTPRDNELGGRYERGVARTYTAGQVT